MHFDGENIYLPELCNHYNETRSEILNWFKYLKKKTGTMAKFYLPIIVIIY
jgi:hypothetical protein